LKTDIVIPPALLLLLRITLAILCLLCFHNEFQGIFLYY
jgi:hypothetical protein